MNCKSLYCWGSLLILALAAPARSEAAPIAQTQFASSFQQTLAQAVGGACPNCQLLSLERRALTSRVAEYSFPVRVGPGAHDLIRLHRVVAESAPFVPVRASRALFMAHGDAWGFDAAFLSSAASPAVADAHALPVYLAEAGIDVWGIDFRWTLVPAGTTDLAFMADWGIETDARDLGVGLAVARFARGLGGNGFGRIHLLGWSRGGQIGYAYLSGETQVPAALRQVRGFIPVDIYLKTDVPSIQAAACLRLGLTLARQNAGEVADATGALVATLGNLAKSAPGGLSSIFPGLTHRQAALLTVQATFNLFPPGGQIVPFYHFNGGTFDGGGLPNGLVYSPEAGVLDFLTLAAPFEPLEELADGDAAICESSPDFAVPDVPFDDHLAQITVPILYVGAGGGFGDFGVYTTTLLGSSDISTRVVTLRPPTERLFDIGHADIFQATDAPTLFWRPILDWLRSH